jgi:hypothetical protein
MEGCHASDEQELPSQTRPRQEQEEEEVTLSLWVIAAAVVIGFLFGIAAGLVVAACLVFPLLCERL